MPADQWVLVSADAVVATVLLYAALAKLAAPAPLGRSLLKLTNSSRLAGPEAVRAIGVIEALVAVGLLVEPVRTSASGLLILLGLAFISLGISGRARHIDEPCGCFGAASQQPLGNQNIVLGVLIAIVGALNLASSVQLSHDARAAGPILTAGLLSLASIATWHAVSRQRPDQLEPS